MRKAIITGFVTGLLISAIVIGANFLRPVLPDTFTANLFFAAVLFLSIVGVLWLSLNYYCRTSEVRWISLGVTGMVSSMIAAVIVSTLGYSVYHFVDLAGLLFLVSAIIVSLYYAINRNRQTDAASKNHELIF